MAKEQKRGNREVRKPKQIKKPVVEAPTSLVRGALASLGSGKKKG